MATLTGKLVSQTYKALLKMIDNDILTESEKQISDGYGQGTGIFIDDNGFIRASSYKVTGGSSSQFLKGDGSLDGTGYLPVGTTTSAIAEGSRLYFTQARVLETTLTGFVSTEGTVTAADSILSAINKIWWNIENGGGGGGGYVPYTGATQNLNLGTYGLISDYIQLNLAPTSIPTTAGTMSWDDGNGTANLTLKGGNVNLALGQELVARVYNATGADLVDGQVVYISGAQGNRVAVGLASSTLESTSSVTFGMVTEPILDGEEGFVTVQGTVNKLDTSGLTEGEMLWLGETAGTYTNVKPVAPINSVLIGYVERVHATVGSIYVKIQNGYELEELHNVLITTPEDEDVLFYDGVDGLWINKNIYTAINATDVGKSLLGILNAEDTTPVTTKPRGIRINVDNSVDALEVGTQGYLPFYDETDFYIDSPVFTDGDQVFIGGDDSYLSVNSKLTVVGGNLTVDDNWGIHLGLYQILFRYNATGELRFGTGVPNDFITFFANSTERMRLSASGFLGLGVTNPASMIHAKATTAYPKIIIDNASPSGGGMFSAYQNGTETAMFGVSGAWLIDNSSDAAIVATRAGQGIQFYTNGSNSEKMGINSDGNVFVGQTPTYFAGATQLIVRGKTGAGFLGVQHFDMSIRGSINTFNSVFQVGTSTFHAVAVIVEDIERARFNSAGRMLLGTTTDNTVDKLQIDGSLIATAIKKTGGTSSQFLKADGSVDSTAYGTGSVTSVSASVPTGFDISGSPITTSGTLAISFASGYSLPTNVKQGNWDDAYTFVANFPTQTGNAGKYLTTDGSTLSWGTIVSGVSSFNSRTGAVTLVGSDVINALGYTPVTNARTITINGTTQDLSANITFTTGGVTSFNTRDGAVTLSSLDVTTALGFTPVTQARSLSINGQAYDLSADRSWTITAGSGMRNVTHYTATEGQTTFTITGGYTVGLIDIFLNGVRIPESDFTATNGTTVVFTTGVKVGDIVTAVLYTASATSGITGAGTAGYLAKWTGTSAINGSLIYDDGSKISIGGTTPSNKFQVVDSVNSTVANFYYSGGPNVYLSFSAAASTTAYIGNAGSNLVFEAGSSERLRIASTGFVGINTSTPAAILDVYGANVYLAATNKIVLANAFSGVNSNSPELAFYGQTYQADTAVYGPSIQGVNQTSYGRKDLVFYQHSAADYSTKYEAMRLTYSGNLGVGTSTPDTSLHVLGSTNRPIVISTSNASTIYTTYRYNTSTDVGYIGNGTGTVGGASSNDFGIQAVENFVIAAGGSTERMRIQTNGRIAIGMSTSYYATLSVKSNSTTNYQGFNVYANGNGNFVYINHDNNRGIIGTEYGPGGTGFTPLTFETNGTERMRLTTLGQLLIGSSSAANSGLLELTQATQYYNILTIKDTGTRYTATDSFYIYFVNSTNGAAGGVSHNTASTINYYSGPSDLRLKTNIKKWNQNVLDLFRDVEPVTFEITADNDGYIHKGYIAQQMVDKFPEAYGTDKNGYYTYIPDGFIPYLVKSTKELIYRFETHAEKIARLEMRVQQLEAK